MPSEIPLPSSLWSPMCGPQEEALKSKADIVFYGGAAGGGKTDLLIGAAFLRHQRSIIFRREYAQLKAIIDRSVELFDKCGKFNKSNMVWSLTGHDRTIELGAVQHFGDERKYQGRAHDLKAFDELAHFSEAQFRTLCGWLRSADPHQRCRVLAAGNPPTDSEGDWIIRFFAPWLDKTHAHPARPGELRWFTMIDGKDTELESGEEFEHNGEMLTPKSRTFIPARVEDNKYYMDSGYKATLQGLPEPLRSKMLYGDFTVGYEDSAFQIVPTEWLELAVKRYGAQPNIPLTAVGVDVARGGRDKTVITLRYGHWFAEQKVYPGRLTPDGDTVATLVLALRGASPCNVHVDVIGVGASVFDALRRYIGNKAIAFNASNASTKTDRSGQLAFRNRRAEWWWALREALDPAQRSILAIPNDRELIADLVAPRFLHHPGGLTVESKDDIVKRIGRSPDKGDSFVYAHATPHIPGGGVLDYYRRMSEQ